MKKILALVLLQVAAAVLGNAVAFDHGSSAGHWTQCVIGVVAAVVWIAVCLRAHRQQRALQYRPEPKLTQDDYHRDVSAVAYGEMDEEDFDRKWAGRVPPSPRPPRRKDRHVELFKEIFADMSGDPVTINLPAAPPGMVFEVKRAIEEVKEHPTPRFREGQYVRMLDTIWIVNRSVKCHGPKDSKWWGYYVERGWDSRHPFEKDITLALPHVGEVWEKRQCDKHPDPMPGAIRAFQVKDEHDWYLCLDRADDCECGCLVPVNFGRGWERQSFDPSKLEKPPHTGVQYIVGTGKLRSR